MQKIKEQDIVNQIITYLTIEKIFCWRQNTSGIYMVRTNSYRPSKARGVADILGILPTGQALAIEVKRPGAKLDNPYQIEFRDNVIKNNGCYILAYSIDDVINGISNNAKKTNGCYIVCPIPIKKRIKGGK